MSLKVSNIGKTDNLC